MPHVQKQRNQTASPTKTSITVASYRPKKKRKMPQHTKSKSQALENLRLINKNDKSDSFISNFEKQKKLDEIVKNQEMRSSCNEEQIAD